MLLISYVFSFLNSIKDWKFIRHVAACMCSCLSFLVKDLQNKCFMVVLAKVSLAQNTCYNLYYRAIIALKPTITDLLNCRHTLNRILVMVTNGKCMTVMVNHCYNILTQQIETRICECCRLFTFI